MSRRTAAAALVGHVLTAKMPFLLTLRPPNELFFQKVAARLMVTVLGNQPRAALRRVNTSVQSIATLATRLGHT